MLGLDLISQSNSLVRVAWLRLVSLALVRYLLEWERVAVAARY
jgi:hypothetical protein